MAWVKDGEDSTEADVVADREEGIDSFREAVELIKHNAQLDSENEEDSESQDDLAE